MDDFARLFPAIVLLSAFSTGCSPSLESRVKALLRSVGVEPPESVVSVYQLAISEGGSFGSSGSEAYRVFLTRKELDVFLDRLKSASGQSGLDVPMTTSLGTTIPYDEADQKHYFAPDRGTRRSEQAAPEGLVLLVDEDAKAAEVVAWW